MNQHGELTEDLEWKDRQGLEWRGFWLLAVTLFPFKCVGRASLRQQSCCAWAMCAVGRQRVCARLVLVQSRRDGWQ